MESGRRLEGVNFGFKDEKYYPSGNTKYVECIHWTIDHFHKGRLMVHFDTTSLWKYTLSIHEAPTSEGLYREDARVAIQPKLPIIKWQFYELDPLSIVSILEEWKKQEPLKYVVADEAGMLSLPS